MSAIDTTSSRRRTLSFASPADVLSDLDRLEAAHRQGRLHATGNWDAGTIFRHLAIPIQRSMDGFEASPVPLWRKVLGRLVLRPIVLRVREFKPGIRLDRRTEAFLWQATSFDDGLTMLREQIRRWAAEVPMSHPHPAFGPMTQSQWSAFHLKHCALHLSFLLPCE